MRFIKLTRVYSINDFVDIYLNVDEIGVIQEEKTDDYTIIFTKHDIVCEVKETPEEILKKIANAGVIKNESD